MRSQELLKDTILLAFPSVKAEIWIQAIIQELHRALEFVRHIFRKRRIRSSPSTIASGSTSCDLTCSRVYRSRLLLYSMIAFISPEAALRMSCFSIARRAGMSLRFPFSTIGIGSFSRVEEILPQLLVRNPRAASCEDDRADCRTYPFRTGRTYYGPLWSPS